MAGAERGVQRALPLAAEHQAVDTVRAQVVLRQSQPEIQSVRVAVADARLRLAVHVDLKRLVETGDVLAEDVLEPADDLHAALVRARQHVGDDVVVRMIGCLLGAMLVSR